MGTAWQRLCQEEEEDEEEKEEVEDGGEDYEFLEMDGRGIK